MSFSENGYDNATYDVCQNWKNAKQSEFQRYAYVYQDQYETGHVACVSVEKLIWSYDSSYRLNRFGSHSNWTAWFANEQYLSSLDCGAPRYDDMLKAILHPIVVVEIQAHAYLWDGNHRVGGSFTAGRTNIPAIIGRPIKS